MHKAIQIPRLIACAGLALCAWVVAAQPNGPVAKPNAVVPQPNAALERGRYLATAGDCVACHTAPGGASMAGGLALASPMGAIYSTNITPSKTHGIGNYSLQQFGDALRLGKRADGAYLYPAMPYTAYARMSDEDIADLYAYFMQGVVAEDHAAPATALPFPFNIRFSLALWNALFHDPSPFKPDPAHSSEWNRGAYLVQGPTHCSTCHTPRNALMAEDPRRFLGGAEVAGWYAPNISSDITSGIGRWKVEELVAYLRAQPVPGKGPAAGPMAEAVDHSLKHLSQEDLKAIAVYIRSVPAVADPAVQQAADSFGQATDQLDSLRGTPLPKDLSSMSGAQMYDAYCATCHQAQGQGSERGGLPSLFHNTSLGHANSNNLVQSVLHGVHRVGADTVMPGFAHELSDAQISTLSNYLLSHYGNPQATVSEQQVAKLRNPATAGTDTRLLNLARGGMLLGLIVLLAVIAWFVRRSRRP